MNTTGCLYIVATPIGNLGDMTYRAIEILKTVDLIAAEDTRHSQRLLKHYEIPTRMISLHQFNEEKRISELETCLQQNQQIALISDAGTPLISDPGYLLVRHFIQKGFRVIPIPGACAIIAAISASGLATDHFIFEGFLPVKAGERVKHLQSLQFESRTLVFYEAPHRILALMDSLLEVFGPHRNAVIAREITKTFETFRFASLSELKQWLLQEPKQQLGEFVVMIEGVKRSSEEESLAEYRRVLEILLLQLPLKQAVQLAVQITNGPRRLLYQLALERRSKNV